MNEQAHDKLVRWYRAHRRSFPWRENPQPYWVWIAEIMSQQTQMSTLLPYFQRFIERFSTVTSLARAHEDEVLAAWTGLGYYSRARNVHRTAKKIVEELGGVFPQSLEQWLELPGVGPYTAAAVTSQCFGVLEPVWDGNVLRVCSRLGARADALSALFRTEMLNNLRKKIQKHDPSEFNQAFMELGATVCTPKAPACDRCPLETECEARARGAATAYPPPKPRKETIDLRCRVLVRMRAQTNEVLLQRRQDDDWFSGMWDFPSELGGVAQPIRALHKSARARPFGRARHQITHHRIELEGWMDVEAAGKSIGNLDDHSQWVLLSDLMAGEISLPLSTTARKILKVLTETDCLGEPKTSC